MKAGVAGYVVLAVAAAAALFAWPSSDGRFTEARVLTVVHDASGGFGVVLVEKQVSSPDPGKTLKALVITVGPYEGQSIAMALGGGRFVRPLTHDLTLEIIRRLKAKVARVTIHSLQQETYFARLDLETEGGRITMDCRPSDGIALALRAEVPILVAPSLFQETQVHDRPPSPRKKEEKPSADRAL